MTLSAVFKFIKIPVTTAWVCVTNKRLSQRALCALLLMSAPLVSFAAEEFKIPKETLDYVEKLFGVEARARVEAWRALVVESVSGNYGDSTKLEQANDFFNQVRWLTDIEHWGQDDYWATPVETLASNGGDCEDFSIGKFFSLANSALETDRLRITYVKSVTYNQAHMVLAYYATPGAEPLILDNINKTILPASQRPDLIPVYSFNAQDIWLAKTRDGKLKASSQTSLPKWAQVNKRMLEELGGAR